MLQAIEDIVLVYSDLPMYNNLSDVLRIPTRIRLP